MKKPFVINCASCLKSEYCTELCEVARKFADQDYVALKEKTLGRPLHYSTWGVWDRYVVAEGVVLNDQNICLMVLLSSGVPSGIVKKGMRISQSKLNDSVRVIRKEYEKNTENR